MENILLLIESIIKGASFSNKAKNCPFLFLELLSLSYLDLGIFINNDCIPSVDIAG